jgi:hypothetical protein
MPGQVIGTVNVQINKQQPSTVSTIVGGRTTLKSATDLVLTGAEDGDVISYIANTNSFQVKAVSALAIPKIDGGQY